MTRLDPRDARIREALAPALSDFLANRRWFGGKARSVRLVEVRDLVPLTASPLESFLLVALVTYAHGPTENYSVPLILKGPEAQVPESAPFLSIKAPGEPEDYVLYDAMQDPWFLQFLFEAIVQEKSFSGTGGKVTATHTAALGRLWQPSHGPMQPSVMKVEQSNTSALFGKRLVLKLFRRLEEGINPDVEIGAFLTADSRFSNAPAVAGHMEYTATTAQPCSLAILQAYVPNQGDAWSLTLNSLTNYYGRSARSPIQPDEIPQGRLLALADQPVPSQAQERIGNYLQLTRLLAQRTAELHLALSSATEDPVFRPEPFSAAGLRAFCDTAVDLAKQTFELLREKQSILPADAHALAAIVLAAEKNAVQRLRSPLDIAITAMCTRIHGDYHLGQVLFTGEDFMIIDFEGEPARSLPERRAKRSPLQDVAGMLRSFHYAAFAPLLADRPRSEHLPQVATQARYWQTWVSATFLKTYLDISRQAIRIPRSPVELQTLLDAFLLDKALYELRYELNNRPQWVAIPLEGIAQLLAHGD